MTDHANRLLVVGLGASAGGVGALKALFSRVKGDAGIAYVAILHLSPEDESHLGEVLQTSSPIPVIQVRDRTWIEADHVYVIPPNRRPALTDGFLEVTPVAPGEDRRAPVDGFFRALADARGTHAACVVLTGTGADGSNGLKRIKERGGLCLVQDPREAEHDDMPRSAIATGLVDGVLPVAEIAGRLASYRQALVHGAVGEDRQRLDSEERAMRAAAVFQPREVGTRPIVFAVGATLPAASPNAGAGAAPMPGPRVVPADLHLHLLEQYAPPSVLISEDHEILHLSSNAGRFLQFGGGAPSTNLVKAVHSELRLELRAALYEAGEQRRPIQGQPLRLVLDERPVTVTIHVKPVLRDSPPASGVFLVLFEESTTTPDDQIAVQLPRGEAARQLEAELLRLKRQLRTIVEQHEVQSEELKASNEELQAMNEELRSTAEELETSKEELQSVNAELSTVNQDLRTTLEEQKQSNSDIRNLIQTTGMAAIFLDRELRIKLVTPPSRELFHLIASDAGRPLSDINSQLAGDGLQRDVEQALQDLSRIEREVSARNGRSYLMHVVPYQGQDERVEGVVLSFVDISERKRFELELRKSAEWMRLVIDSITEYAILTLDADGLIIDWNVGAERLFGYAASEVIGRPGDLIFTPEDRARGAHVEEMRTARLQGRAADERWHVRKDGSRLFLSGVLSLIGPDPATGYVKVARDLTEQRQQEAELRRAHALLESRVHERTSELADELSERRLAEERVRRLLSRLITVQEDERRRIARDLHDDLGQKMTALHLKLEALRRATAGVSSAHAQVEEAQAFVQQLDRDLDFFTWELRPAALYDLGLTQALRDFVAQWGRNYTIPSAFEAINVGQERWRPDIEINLYRIAQEALNNIYKHAKATNVDVVLQRRGDELVLTIEDNGTGFDPSLLTDPSGRSIGLIGMRERAALVGGTLEIERAASGGTTVMVRAPAAEPQAAPPNSMATDG